MDLVQQIVAASYIIGNDDITQSNWIFINITPILRVKIGMIDIDHITRIIISEK